MKSFPSQPLGKLGSEEHQMSPSSLLHLLSDWLKLTEQDYLSWTM